MLKLDRNILRSSGAVSAMRTVACTICSRAKAESDVPLPARELYLGAHIKNAQRLAEKENLDYYILSGLHGFISSEQKLLPYDYRLRKSGLDALVEKITQQLTVLGVKKVVFFSEGKESWSLYTEALDRATHKLGQWPSIRLLPPCSYVVTQPA